MYEHQNIQNVANDIDKTYRLVTHVYEQQNNYFSTFSVSVLSGSISKLEKSADIK